MELRGKRLGPDNFRPHPTPCLMFKVRPLAANAPLVPCTSASAECECLLGKISKLPISHLLGHIEDELPIGVRGLTHQSTESVEIACVLAAAAPNEFVGRRVLQEVRQFRRLFSVVKELIKRAFKREPASRAFRPQGPCARFRREKCSSEEDPFAFRCRPERVVSPHASRGGGRL
jgi:hypothetical protein